MVLDSCGFLISVDLVVELSSRGVIKPVCPLQLNLLQILPRLNSGFESQVCDRRLPLPQRLLQEQSPEDGEGLGREGAPQLDAAACGRHSMS